MYVTEDGLRTARSIMNEVERFKAHGMPLTV
jgi:hypothetical protein